MFVTQKCGVDDLRSAVRNTCTEIQDLDILHKKERGNSYAMFTEAFAYLATAIRLDPAIRDDAQEYHELENLRSDERFIRLTGL